MRKTIISYAVLALILFSCYPGGIEYYEETDLVYTDYEPEYDFTGLSTYAIPDQIVKVTGNVIEGEVPEVIPEPYNSQILGVIETNMSAYGWTKAEDPEDADIVLLPASWTNTTIYYWYDYWCWYYPYYCGWGWYYPGYVTSYTTGTLVMTLVASGDDFIEPMRVWAGAINGLMSGAYNVSRVTNGVDQAFKQSPYLKIN